MSLPTSLVRHAPRNAFKLPAFTIVPTSRCPPISRRKPGTTRCLATVKTDTECLSGVWFNSTIPRHNTAPPNDPSQGNSNERKVKLGKTLRALQDRMPTLLQAPLPQELLSPHITLHLFPSTHPHLFAVSGRKAYTAALWTSPIVWGRMPLISNVKLEILSERMIKSPHYVSSSSGRREQLIVRWRTVGKTRGKGMGAFYKGIGAKDNVDKITEWLGGGKGEDDSKEFTGLFIFEFDDEGRVLSHTIEHVQEGGSWEKGVGARVVGLTDWLLGGMRNGRGEGNPCPAFSGVDRRGMESRLR